MNALVRAWLSVSARLSANPWLRRGLGLALLLVLGHGVALQHGRLAGVQADYEDAVEGLERTEGLIDQGNWMEFWRWNGNPA